MQETQEAGLESGFPGQTLRNSDPLRLFLGLRAGYSASDERSLETRE